MENNTVRIHYRYILTHREEEEPTYDFTMIQSYPQGINETVKVDTLVSSITGIETGDFTWNWTVGDSGPYHCSCRFCTIQ
jgi:hypothetical protein